MLEVTLANTSHPTRNTVPLRTTTLRSLPSQPTWCNQECGVDTTWLYVHIRSTYKDCKVRANEVQTGKSDSDLLNFEIHRIDWAKPRWNL